MPLVLAVQAAVALVTRARAEREPPVTRPAQPHLKVIVAVLVLPLHLLVAVVVAAHQQLAAHNLALPLAQVVMAPHPLFLVVASLMLAVAVAHQLFQVEQLVLLGRVAVARVVAQIKRETMEPQILAAVAVAAALLAVRLMLAAPAALAS